MNNTALTTIDQTPRHQAIDPYSPRDFSGAWEMAQIVCKSRLAPSIQTPEAAFLVMALGSDMGMSLSQSLRGIQIIEGKPSPTADCLAACVLRSGLAEYFIEVETDKTHSTWETRRKGEKLPRRSTFSMDDAKQAGLVKPNGNWAKYPERMMKARAKAFLARDVYPDLTLGLYTPEELRDEPIHVEVEQVETHDETPEHFQDPETFDSKWREDLASCTDQEELKKIARQAVNDGELSALVTAAFRARLAELSK